MEKELKYCPYCGKKVILQNICEMETKHCKKCTVWFPAGNDWIQIRRDAFRDKSEVKK